MQIKFNPKVVWASREYNMYMGNVLKCKTYLQLESTRSAIRGCQKLSEKERANLFELADIKQKNLGVRTQVSHAKI